MVNMDEEFKHTRGQKILATGIVIFLLIFAGNFLVSLGNWVEEPDLEEYRETYGVNEISDELESCKDSLKHAKTELNDLKEENHVKYEKYEMLREEYRVSLERGEGNTILYEEYREAKREYEKSENELSSVEEECKRLENEVWNLESRLKEKKELALNEHKKAKNVYDAKVLGLRLAFFAPLLILSIISYIKIKSSRFKQYMLLCDSFLSFSIILSVWSIGAFVYKIVSVMVMTLFGGIACILGLIYITKQRQSTTMLRRIMDNKCPWCSTPIKGKYCIKCGKPLVEKCKNCGKEKPILVPHCPHCGV